MRAMLIGKGGAMVDTDNLTTFEAARLVGVDESTIRRQCAAGRIVGAFRGVLRKREIWMIPAVSLRKGVTDVLQPVSEGLEGDQPGD